MVTGLPLMVQVTFVLLRSRIWQNIIIFGVDNSSSKNPVMFVMFGKRPTERIEGKVSEPEKKFSINFITSKTNFCLDLYKNDNKCYLCNK